MKKLNRELRQWETICNTVVPIRLSATLTPQRFLWRIASPRSE
jgi:hypothetical protein